MAHYQACPDLISAVSVVITQQVLFLLTEMYSWRNGAKTDFLLNRVTQPLEISAETLMQNIWLYQQRSIYKNQKTFLFQSEYPRDKVSGDSSI